MAVKYDIYESPSRGQGKEQSKMHARVVTDGTVTTEELEQKIEYGTSLTQGDVKAVLLALSYQLIDMLKRGKRVHLEGFGYFQLTLDCNMPEDAEKLRGDSVFFKSIAFRPEKSVKNELKNLKFVRSTYKKHSSKRTDNDIERLLKQYFEEYPYITRKQFEDLTGLTQTTAFRKLKKLVDTSKLKKGAGNRFPIYEPLDLE